MPTNPKGYRPKKSRVVFPLTVKEQRKLIEYADEQVRNKVPRASKMRALILVSLSVGIHPKVLSQHEKYAFEWKAEYYSWNRPKTRRQVQGAWSRLVRRGDTLVQLKRWLGKDVSTYRKALRAFGDECGIPGMSMLKNRHTYFANKARLGHDQFSIAHGAATSLRVIESYYTIGMGESRSLSPEDREFLSELMEA